MTGRVEDAVDPGVTAVEILRRLVRVDVSGADAPAIDAWSREALKVRCWLDAFDAELAARTRALHPTPPVTPAKGRSGSAPSTAAGAVLTGGGRRGQREADAAAARSEVCAAMPAIAAALARGAVTAGHVDALVAAWARLDGAGRSRLIALGSSVLRAATTMTPEQFARECRDLARVLTAELTEAARHEQLRTGRHVKRWTDHFTGEHKTLINLDPLADERLWAAIRHHLAATRSDGDPRTNDQRTADAFVDLITGAQAVEPRAPEVMVLVDLATLAHGLHRFGVSETSDGTPLTPDEIRRLACDADLIPVVLGGTGETLDVGRARRLATRAQRRGLRAMYATCAHPGCTVTFERCRIHHVNVEWEHGGRTDLANLIPVCERHHHLVHEGGWTMRMAPDRTITLTTREGAVAYHGPSINRHGPLTAPSSEQCDRRAARPAGAGTRPPIPASARQFSFDLGDDVVGATARAGPDP